jgi:hypothetical protein
VPGPRHVQPRLVCKCCDTEITAEIYGREGIDLARSTMADRFGKTGALLASLVAALRGHVLPKTGCIATGKCRPEPWC